MEARKGAKKLRSAVKKVATVLEDVDRRVTHEELVAMCAQTTPSVLGKLNGKFLCLVLSCKCVYV